MKLYEARDLKRQFKELDRLNAFTLIPIFDRVANSFFEELVNNHQKYGISDGRKMPKQSGGSLWDRVNDPYILVIDGKIVSFVIHRDNISVVDTDEYWWMADRMEFGYDEKGANRLFNHAKEFVSKQELDNLVKQAKEELEKGKTYHLSPEMRAFYLR